MPEPRLSPSQQVERIRDILVGRQMQQVEERLEKIEASLGQKNSDLASEISTLREELAQESADRTAMVEDVVSRVKALEEAAPPAASLAAESKLLSQVKGYLEELSSGMTARIDARADEVISHLEAEISHLRTRLENDFNHLHEQKADRHELRHRFSKLALAAMEEPPAETGELPKEFIP